MKIWCETCQGMQWVENNLCIVCKGDGYTENTELEHLAEIVLAMRHLSITGGYMTAEELERAEKNALEVYRKHKKEVE